jgi:flagellar FliJ protein
MPKFTFKLAAVLRHREMIEEQRQRELGIALTEMAKMQAELNALDATAKGVSDDVRNNRLTGKLDMSFLAAHRRYTIAIQRQAMQLAQKMAQQQILVDAARKQLAEAAKDRKILEKLKEKQQERWKTEMGRQELENLSEVNMQLALEPHFITDDGRGT